MIPKEIEAKHRNAYEKINFIKSKTNSWFYSEEQVSEIKERLQSGERATRIARSCAVKFNKNERSILNKINSIKRSLKLTKSKENSQVSKNSATVITLPEGFTFSGTCKKVEISNNYFKVYF